MNAWMTSRGISKSCYFGGMLAISGACCVISLPGGIGSPGVGAREGGVIGSSQRSAFLAYVERRRMRSASSVEGVSAGDVLPQDGVIYYDIPLRFGAGLDRCAVIAGRAVIVDPETRRVVEVID